VVVAVPGLVAPRASRLRLAGADPVRADAPAVAERAMTVEDLINVLVQCPDLNAEVQARINVRDDDTRVLTWVHVDITDVDEDHGTVLLDTDVIPGQL
jgi:hypothetical protein